MAAIATTTATAQVWSPLIEAQAKAMEEFLVEKGIAMTDEMRSDIVSVLEQQTDDHATLFKKKAGRKAGSKTTKKTTGKQCCAYTYGNGTPKRCTRCCGVDEGDYCSMHSKECAKYGGKPKHGRFDEEIPLKWTKYDKGLPVKEGTHEWKSDELVERLKEAGLYKEKAVRGRKRSSSATKAPKKKSSKRAPSAYNLFMKDPEQRAKAEGETAPEKMKGLSKIWKELSDEEKRPYEEESARLKEEMKEKLRDEAEEAEKSEEASIESETSSVTEEETVETPEKEPVKEPETKPVEEETDPDEMSGDVDDLLEDESEIDVEAFPTITHKMMKTTVRYDADSGMLYDNDTKALLGPISGMGGKAAFDMSNVL